LVGGSRLISQPVKLSASQSVGLPSSRTRRLFWWGVYSQPKLDKAADRFRQFRLVWLVFCPLDDGSSRDRISRKANERRNPGRWPASFLLSRNCFFHSSA